MLVYNFLPKESLVSLTATTGKQAMRRDIVLSTLVATKTQNVGSQQPLWSRFRCQCHVTYRGKGGRELYRDHTAAAAPALPPLQIYAQQIVQTAPLPSRSPLPRSFTRYCLNFLSCKFQPNDMFRFTLPSMTV